MQLHKLNIENNTYLLAFGRANITGSATFTAGLDTGVYRLEFSCSSGTDYKITISTD